MIGILGTRKGSGVAQQKLWNSFYRFNGRTSGMGARRGWAHVGDGRTSVRPYGFLFRGATRLSFGCIVCKEVVQ